MLYFAMKVLVHTCCADCLLKMVDSLKNETTEITAYFYNPNIHPRAEYLSRLKAVKQISEENKIKLVVADWSPKEWFKEVKGGSKRCEGCWNLRLRKTFEYASKNNFEVVATTLLSSHYQNKDKIYKLGKGLEDEFKIKFLIPEKISRDLKTTGFYKQNYCGCCYSLVEAWEEKFDNQETNEKK
jgi:predicted adenine nucleotide alpha hydrolase (AANH) superfamily ATPase